MKFQFLFIGMLFTARVFSQDLQMHYDFRHSVDPGHNPKNFPTLYFEYFKSQDSGSSVIQPGSFLLKTQYDFVGNGGTIGKLYFQVSQSMRFWKPRVYLDVQFSGGFGIAEPGGYGYYISNAFSLGAAYPFQWNGVVWSASASYVYNAFAAPSHDVRCTLYWWKGFWNFTAEFSGDVQAWTQNRNTGEAFTASLRGKRLVLYAEPEVWFSVNGWLSIGSKVFLFYHVMTAEDLLQVYPTVALRFRP